MIFSSIKDDTTIRSMTTRLGKFNARAKQMLTHGGHSLDTFLPGNSKDWTPSPHRGHVASTVTTCLGWPRKSTHVITSDGVCELLAEICRNAPLEIRPFVRTGIEYRPCSEQVIEV